MDEDIRKILEAAGWQPDDAFAELTHYNNIAHCGAPALCAADYPDAIIVGKVVSIEQTVTEQQNNKITIS